MKSINELLVVMVVVLVVIVSAATWLDTEYNRSHTRLDILDFHNTLKGE